MLKQSLRPIRVSGAQWAYLRDWTRTHWARFVTPLLGWTALVLLLEITLPLVVHVVLEDAVTYLRTDALWRWAAVGLAGVSVFLFASFRGLMARKGLVVYLLNTLRRDHTVGALNRQYTDLNAKGSLMAKISYHFALLQMGLTQSLFSGLELLFLMLGVLGVGFWLGPVYYVSALVALPIYALLAVVSHFISRYYVSRDQTLYSKIIRHISVLADESFISPRAGTQQAQLAELDNLVELDSFFRIRRDVWMKYGSAVLFAVLLMVGAGAYIIELSSPFLPLESHTQTVTYAIFVGLLIRGLYLAHRVGLFWFPAYVGAALSVPERGHKLRRDAGSWTAISFRSSHVGLSDGRTKNKLNWQFDADTHTQIAGVPQRDEGQFIDLFTGQAGPNRGRQWMVKVDDTRVSYSAWSRGNQPVLLLDALLVSDRDIVELLLNKPRTQLHQNQITQLLKTLGQLTQNHPDVAQLTQLIIQKTPAKHLPIDQKLLLKCLWAHLHKPSLVAVPSSVTAITPGAVALLRSCKSAIVSFAPITNLEPDTTLTDFSQ